MSKGVTVRKDLWDRWNEEKDQNGLTSLSFSDWIDSLIDQGTGLQTTTINQEGRFEGSKGLSGKTIEWREKITIYPAKAGSLFLVKKRINKIVDSRSCPL